MVEDLVPGEQVISNDVLFLLPIRHVFQEERVQRLIKRNADPERRRERDQEGRRPEGRDLAEVMVPELRRKQGRERDREQDAEKRQPPFETESGAVNMRGRGVGGENRCRIEEDNRPGQQGSAARR
jgi:hypothetical protein